MKSLHFAPALIVLIGIFCACEETSTIGSSLVEDQLKIVIDSTFTATGHSVKVDGIRSRTTTQMLGSIDVPAYGRLSSNVVMQFTSATVLDTADYRPQDVDSLHLIMRCGVGSFLGDSVVPMGLTVYPLTRQLPSPIFSDFDPEGYYDPSEILATKVYNMSSMNSDSISLLSYRDINIKLPRELGVNLFQSFVDNPASFATPQSFSRDVFPGVYVASTYGSGRLSIASLTAMRMYCSRVKYNEDEETNDTISGSFDYFVVTPEVVSNNNITYTMDPSLKAMVDDGEPLVVSPTGYEVEMEFPIRDIVDAYRAAGGEKVVVNTLTLQIPADSIPNDSGVAPPPYMLLVLSNKRDSFFANSELPDNQTSFYATYDATSRSYSFTALKNYLSDILTKEEITAEDYTFRLVPVLVTFETVSSYYSSSQVESSVVPYISTPAMAKLDIDKAKIKFTYSLQSQK